MQHYILVVAFTYLYAMVCTLIYGENECRNESSIDEESHDDVCRLSIWAERVSSMDEKIHQIMEECEFFEVMKEGDSPKLKICIERLLSYDIYLYLSMNISHDKVKIKS